MSRSIILSNSRLAVALDHHGMVRDVYYPHVGHEDHVRGNYLHRVGIFIDNQLHWLSDGSWVITVRTHQDALMSIIEAHHDALQVAVTISDIVCDEKNIFIRRVVIKNLSDSTRDIKVYFGQEFEIQKMHGSDTAYFDPHSHSVIHYKGRRVFLIGGTIDGDPCTDFATGRARFHDREGSYRDAEDGELSKNPIEHGPADSIIGFYAPYAKDQERTCYYWICAGQSIPEAVELDSFVKSKTPEHLMDQTIEFWRSWLSSLTHDFADLEQSHIDLYRKSLLFSRAHVDHQGGIIASLDSDMFQYGLDTYSYVWMRDASYIALALDEAGDTEVLKKLLHFCKDTITREGYVMHKYLPDTSLGSSWHPWVQNGQFQLPIQEDETAIVIVVLDEYMRRHDDMPFLESVFTELVERAANFLVSYRLQDLHLPAPSYDLWERKRGISTYTSASVFAALKAAARLSRMLKKATLADRYERAATEIHHAILTHLWNRETGLFYNMLQENQGARPIDATVDISSVYGIFRFGVLPPSEMRLLRAFTQTVAILSEGIAVGGMARFENDDYYRVPGQSKGNPWFLTRFWHAEYLIATASSVPDLAKARDIFSWAVRYALPSGGLSEQLDPKTGDQVCAGPLAWAHAAYVSAVHAYLDKYRHLIKPSKEVVS